MNTEQQTSPTKSRVRKNTQRVTMHEVAHKAKVSPSTVSLYLRQPESVSPKLGKKIQQSIDELKYVPNRFAGTLATTRSKILCVLIPSISNTFFARSVQVMQQACAQAGYTLLIGNTNFLKEQEEELVRTFLQWSPSGIILTGKHHSEETIAMLESSGVVVGQMWDIGTDGYQAGLEVGFDHQLVGELSARHLYQSGCKKVVFLGGDLGVDIRAKIRADSYSETARTLGKHEPIILNISTQSSIAEAGRVMMAALVNDPSIDGVICSNDNLALGVLMESLRRNISVPERLSVIGFGDLAFADAAVPTLTTIHPDSERIGLELVNRVLERCQLPEDNEFEDETIDVGFTLIPRESTRIY